MMKMGQMIEGFVGRKCSVEGTYMHYSVFMNTV